MRKYKKKKIRQSRPPYHWTCEMLFGHDEEGELWGPCWTGSYKRPKDTATFRACFLKFRNRDRNHMCYVGWDVDRHRFFVEGRSYRMWRGRDNFQGQRGRFLTNSWELLHGYASPKGPQHV